MTQVTIVNKYDHINHHREFVRFDDREKAFDHVYGLLNIDKDIEWFRLNLDNLFVEEKDGKLYCHWLDIDYRDTSTLFEYKPNDGLPRTIEDLKEHLESEHSITCLWASRCPLSIKVETGFLIEI